jgi:short-subunit dehydrogenase
MAQSLRRRRCKLARPMPLPPPSPKSTALVTGASSGIGSAFARELAGRGLNVTLVARREDRLRSLAEEIGSSTGVRADYVKADVSSADGRAFLIAELRDRGHVVEVLVNNAGFGSAGRFQELDGDRETLMVRTNCEAIVALCAEYVPGMIDRGRGGVINVASTASFQPLPFQATYSASKAFVRTFTEALTADLHGTGVTATVLCPGPVPTEFGVEAGIDDGSWEGVPNFVMTSPEQNARAAVDGLDKGKRMVLLGPLNHVTATAGHYTPRSVLLGVVRRFYPIGR